MNGTVPSSHETIEISAEPIEIEEIIDCDVFIEKRFKDTFGEPYNIMGPRTFIEMIGDAISSRAYDLAKEVAKDILEYFSWATANEVREGNLKEDHPESTAFISIPIPDARTSVQWEPE